MSIGDISRRTFIQPKFIQAIDEDNFAAIPDSHRRLFIREYARLVEVEPNEILVLLEGYAPPPPPTAPERKEGQARRTFDDERRTPPPSIDPLPESERKAYRDVMSRLSSGRGIKLSGSNVSRWLIGGALLLLILVGMYYAFVHTPGPPEAGGSAPADSASGSPTEILSRNEGDSTVAPLGAAPAADDSLTLEGRATEKVWFSIVMDGKRSDGGTLDSGAVRTWRAGETFKLSLGNAGGLELLLNEKSLGTLGPKHTSVRNQIIDVNGLRKSNPPARRSSAPEPRRRTTPPRTITSTPLRTAP